MMMYERKRLSLAGTAIAAALAVISTPLAAQETGTSDSTTAAPAAADTSATTETAAPAADPLAPAAEAPAATTAATAPAKHKAANTTSKAKAPPVKAKASTTAPAKAAATATPAAAPAPEATAADAAPAVPIARMVAAPKAEPTPAEPQLSLTDPDMVPYAGAAGLSLLALAGLGIAAARSGPRRRKVVREAVTPDEPVAAREPGFVRTAAPVAAASVAPVAVKTANGHSYEAPAGSSPRTVAAYKGPTEENPSLSLKRRLKRARAMDQMERNGTLHPATPRPAETAWTAPARPDRPAFTFRPAEREPAFQH